MNVELFIAKKIHFKQDGEKKVVSPAVRVATIGIALGLAVMILTVAIMVGFKKEVRNKVIGFGSHIQITNFDSNSSYEFTPIAVSEGLLDTLRQFPGIAHVETFATKPGILKTDEDFQGIILKGVDTDYDWTFFEKNLKEGVLPTIDGEKSSTEALLSRALANRLGLQAGDQITTYFVQENGDIRPRNFQITGIYETGFQEYDNLFLLVDIRQVRRLNGWEKDQVSGIEVLVHDYEELDGIAEALFFEMAEKKDRHGNMFFSRSIKELNPAIFSWLQVLDVNVVVILILMILVSGFTMISGLLIVILERTNMIGILKAMGHDNNRIRKVFLYVSFFLIGKGMIWGNLIGLTICFIQARFHLIPLNPANYYLDAVPIDLSLASLILLNIGTLFFTLLMMLAPSYLITKIEPAKTIRFE